MPSSTTKQSRFSALIDYPWHFLLISMVLMSRGYFINRGLFGAGEVALYTSGTVIIVGILFLLLKRILFLHNAGIVTTVFVLVFFSYGYTYEIINTLYLNYHFLVLKSLATYQPYIFVFFALFTLGLFRLQKRDLAVVTTLLNVIGLTLFAGVIVRERTYLFQNNSTTPDSADTASFEIQLPEEAPNSLPDVYYLILDGYPRNDYLESHFGIDNSAFTSELEERGFFIADESLSNYTYTITSLTSSLNMDYVQNLADPHMTADKIENLVVDSFTAQTFQEMGYEYIVIPAGYFSRYSTIADMTIDIKSTGDYLYLDTEQARAVPHIQRGYMQYLYRTSILRILDPTLSNLPGQVYSWISPERIVLQFDALKQIAQNDAPTFTLFHVLKPHTPVVLDRQGNQFEWTDHYETYADYLENEEIHFADQLHYTNEQTLEALDVLLSQSEQPPIIIIQGDHGFPLERFNDWSGNWPIAILNAYHFPDQDYSALREDITPINSFRVIFNQYFGFEYEYLPEKSYFQLSKAGVVSQRTLQFGEIPEGQIESPFNVAD